MTMTVLRKNFLPKMAAVRDGGWRVAHPGHMIRNSTVGIVGFGNNGRGLAKRLAGWECNLLATDPVSIPRRRRRSTSSWSISRRWCARPILSAWR